MADKKISELTSLSQAASGDLLAIVDTAASTTKSIDVANLFSSPLPIGSSSPNTGEFTTLEVTTSITAVNTINEFSTDTNLGTSDTAVPTQNAVKSYVDTQISGLSPNRISQGNSSVTVLDSTSPAAIRFTIDGSVQGTFDSTGLTLALGVTVNEISNDSTLTDVSQTALITEYAAKTYIDTQIAGLTTYHNQLSGLQGGDSTNEYYHLTEHLYDNLYSSGTGVGFGDSTATTLFIDPAASTATAVADQVNVLFLSGSQQILGENNVSTLTLNSTSATIEIGGVVQGTFDSTGLTLASGVTVNEISNDGTLADASQTASVTEYAVKTYVDAQIGGLTTYHNQLSGLQGGDSTSEYYHLTEHLYNNLYSSGSGVGFGDSTTAALFINPITSTTTVTSNQTTVLSLNDIQQVLGENNVSTLTLNSTSATIEIGGVVQGVFDSTGLTLASGVTVNEISNDGTLTGASQTALITEYAAKTYVDTQIAGLTTNHNQLLGLQGGDSTSLEFYHLTEQVYDNLYEYGANGAGFGSRNNTTIIVDPDNDETTAHVDQVAALILNDSYQTLGISENSTITLDGNSVNINVEDTTNVLTITTSGVALENGTRINEFSIDGTLAGNSDDAVPTEQAVKTYVDNSTASGLNVRNVYSDTTAVNGDVVLVDTTAGNVNVELQPESNSRIIVKKVTSDGNSVVVTVTGGGSIDFTGSETISIYLESITFIGDGTNYYIT